MKTATGFTMKTIQSNEAMTTCEGVNILSKFPKLISMFSFFNITKINIQNGTKLTVQK